MPQQAATGKKTATAASSTQAQGQSLANTGDKGAVALPAYIKPGVGRGNENVAVEDVVIPRIEIVQALSPCLKSNDPGFIKGAQQGDLYNSLTRELYGAHVLVVPVFFKKQYLAWRDRKKGGGFGGAYDNIIDARERISREDNPDEWEPTETAQQLVLVIKDDGAIDEAVVSMNRTKLKVSRNWNSLIRLNANDRFSRMYDLFTVDETNSQGQDYKNFGVANSGFPREAAYKKAEALYAALATGARKVVMDTSDMNEGTGTEGGTEY